MLNEYLYDGLVELGLREDKARKASQENQRIAKILESLSELHIQASSMNAHICDVDNHVKEVDGRLTRFEKKVDDRFDRVENRIAGLEGVMRQILEKLS